MGGWLARTLESKDAATHKIAEKFAAYVKNKEETQLKFCPSNHETQLFLTTTECCIAGATAANQPYE
jgi:hypothetical protein